MNEKVNGRSNRLALLAEIGVRFVRSVSVRDDVANYLQLMASFCISSGNAASAAQFERKFDLWCKLGRLKY